MGMKEHCVSNIVTSQQRKGEALNTSIMWRAAVLMRRSIRRKHFQKEVKALTVGLYNSEHLLTTPPVALGENAVVVAASHKGNTPVYHQRLKSPVSTAPVIGLTDNGFTVGGALRSCGNVHVWRR